MENNPAKILYLKLNKRSGQDVLKLIKDKFKNTPIINQKFKILYENDEILFPIINDHFLISKLTGSIRNIDFEFISKEGLPNQNYKYRTLQEGLKDKIPEKYLNLVPKSLDIIGDIVLIEFDNFNSINDNKCDIYKKRIAKVILDIHRNLKTVYEKKSKIKGKYRLRELALLCGEDKSETIHREYNCSFKLDVKNTYFSPRLAFERHRIASSNIKIKELIIDAFSGVGPFSIQIAMLNKVKVYSFDINSHAYKFLKENIKLNKLKGIIYPYNMDVRKLLNDSNRLGRKLHNKSDRIIMNLPQNSLEFIDIACFLIKNTGGILHFYQISEKPHQLEKIKNNLNNNLNKFNWFIEKTLNFKIIKSYSPKSDLIVLDSKIKQRDS